MFPKPNLMTDERLSIQMIVLSGTVVALVMIVFEMVMPPVPQSSEFDGEGIAPNGDVSFNMIVYSISSALHVVMSLFFSFQLWRGIKKMSSPARFAIKRNIIWASLFFFALALLSASLAQLDIVAYSHDRTLAILRSTNWVTFIGYKIPFIGIAWFSLFPLFLVMCGILFAIIACIWSAVKAMDITHNQLQKQHFDRDAIWSEMSMFSVVVASVFLTSTIATTFYLSLGRGLTSEVGYGAFYRNSADGMTIMWASCFSMIMIIIVLFPTGKMNEAARLHHKEHRVLGKDTERFSFVYGALSTERVLKMLAVLFTPVYVAAVRTAIS